MKLLRKDTGLEEAAEIKTAMMDREGWRDRARRTSGPPTGFGVIVHTAFTDKYNRGPWSLLVLIVRQLFENYFSSFS